MLIQNPPVEIGGSLWMLGTTAYPIYLVRGRSEGALIEGGISAVGPLLLGQLAQLGVGAGYLRQAVITHAHPDHVMAVPLLRQAFPGIAVIASAAAAATLGTEKAVSFFRQVDSALSEALFKSGTIADAGDALPKAGIVKDPPSPAAAENRIAVDRVVHEGDVVAVDGVSWSVLETPGHSDCSISLHDPQSRTLVISDASGYYLPGGDAWWPNYFADYAAYLRSLERLAALDAELLCLSHNGAIRGGPEVRAYLAGAIAATRQYHERILAEAQSGKAVRQIAEELGSEIYRQAPLLPLDFFQKNCGLLVKQSLRHAGIALDKPR
jgi:glyoxylase-like metal-dependent hydrolase (beta-lactamase superfamily II)